MERKSLLSGLLCLVGAGLSAYFLLGRGLVFLAAVGMVAVLGSMLGAMFPGPPPVSNAGEVVPSVVAWTAAGFVLTLGLLWLGFLRLAGRPWLWAKTLAVPAASARSGARRR